MCLGRRGEWIWGDQTVCCKHCYQYFYRICSNPFLPLCMFLLPTANTGCFSEDALGTLHLTWQILESASQLPYSPVRTILRHNLRSSVPTQTKDEATLCGSWPEIHPCLSVFCPALLSTPLTGFPQEYFLNKTLAHEFSSDDLPLGNLI